MGTAYFMDNGLGFSHRAAARRHAADHLYQIARRHAADHLYQIMGSVANLPLPDDCTLMRKMRISASTLRLLLGQGFI